MDLASACDIVKLRDLLAPPNADNSRDDCDDVRKDPYAKIPTLSEDKNSKGKESTSSYETLPYDPLDVDAFEAWEKEQQKLQEEKEDLRVQPEYNITYKQQVTTEDVYLQMGNKNASSSSCEAMSVRISLPKTNSSDIELDVQQQTLLLETRDYRLSLNLPHAVHPQKGDAKWDGDKEELIVTLFMDREYDFINF